MKTNCKAPDVERLMEGVLPIPFFASSGKMGEFLARLLSSGGMEAFFECLRAEEWRNVRKGAKELNPLIDVVVDCSLRPGFGGFTDDCLRAMVARAFVVRTDDRVVSELGLRVALGSMMRRRGEQGFSLSDVDRVCGGKRLPQLKSSTYRRGTDPVDVRWESEGLISVGAGSRRGEGGSRNSSRKVLRPEGFPCLVPFPANKYPCMAEGIAGSFSSAHPFSRRLMSHMRERVESRGEYAILKFTPGGESLLAKYEPMIEALRGFDYERRELRIRRPNRAEWETIALFGVLETFNGISLVGYLLDSVVENGRCLPGAMERVGRGLNPLWRVIPIHEDDALPQDDEMDRFRVEYGILLEDRQDWETIKHGVWCGRTAFRERRNYMCAASTDRVLRVRITVGPDGLGRFQRIARSVAYRRTSLGELMPSVERGGLGRRHGVTLPTITPKDRENGTFVYEDLVVGRKEFTKFLRRNMDVIESVEARYESDSSWNAPEDASRRAYDLESYVPKRARPDVRYDPYATGYLWSSYRTLERYARECEKTGMGILVEKDAVLLDEAKPYLEELGERLAGGVRNA